MTISAKLSDVGGLEFVVSDPTDPDDVGGFSDAISVVSAITAKFSDTSNMQANPGLKIGMSQLKINSGTATVRTRTLESSVNWNNPNFAFDGNDTSFSNTTDDGAEIIIDFTTVATTTLKYIIAKTGAASNVTFNIQVSNDNFSYTDLGDDVTSSTSGETVDKGVQTWRFVKVTRVGQSAGGSTSSNLHEVFEDSSLDVTTVRIRSSTAIDTANGTILITSQAMNENQTLTFDTELLLTDPSGFVTLEIVSSDTSAIPISLSEITSVKET